MPDFYSDLTLEDELVPEILDCYRAVVAVRLDPNSAVVANKTGPQFERNSLAALG